MLEFSEPDYKFWDDVNEFPEWQVVCLWAGIEPSLKASQCTKAEVIQRRLTEARVQDRLRSTVKRTDFINAKSDFDVWYQRNDLIEYAKLDGLKPKFLFTEKRNVQNIATGSPTTSFGVSTTSYEHAGQSSPLLTVKQFAKKHPAYTEGALRNLIYRANSTNSSRGTIPGNGLNVAIIRQGRKVLIDEEQFLKWLREMRAKE